MRRTAACFSVMAMALVLTATIGVSGALAQSTPETFTATASVKSAAGETRTMPVVITITRWTTDAERTTVGTAVKSGGTAGGKKTLEGMPDAGTIQVGDKKTPLKYAYMRAIGAGRLVSVVAAQPLGYVAMGTKEGKPKEGYDLALATFQLDAAGKGTMGEMAPAAKVKMDANNAIVTEDYGGEVVRLIDIAKK